MAEHTRQSIGVGVFVKKGDTILVGKRGPDCKLGAGLFALPGGKLEHPESFPDLVRREVFEEAGVRVAMAGETDDDELYWRLIRDKEEAVANCEFERAAQLRQQADSLRGGRLFNEAAPFCVPGLLAVTDHLDEKQQVDGNLQDHLSFWIMTRWVKGVAMPLEPRKCEAWEWVRPRDLLARLGEAAENPTRAQYYWTPAPLWRKILRPYFEV